MSRKTVMRPRSAAATGYLFCPPVKDEPSVPSKKELSRSWFSVDLSAGVDAPATTKRAHLGSSLSEGTKEVNHAFLQPTARILCRGRFARKEHVHARARSRRQHRLRQGPAGRSRHL